MNMTNSGTSCLNIQNLRATYLVSSQHPAPEKVQARLDEAMRQEFGQTLAAAFAPWFARHDDSIWFVRRLEFAADVNAAWGREQIARSMTQQTARSLSAVLSEDAIDGENILRFPNRAAYLAHFLMDLTEDRAWAKWYYQPFAGLRLLPVSAAFRAAVCDDPALGLATLQQMPEAQLRHALQRLSVQDGRLILEKIAGSESRDEFHCLQKAWQAMEKAPLDFFHANANWRPALQIFLRVAREEPKLASATLLGAVRALLQMAALAEDGEKLIAIFSAGKPDALYTFAGAGIAEILAPLWRCPVSWTQEVIAALHAQAHGQPRRQTAAAHEPRFTQFGGVFLLFPLLDELPLAEALHDWTEMERHSLHAVIRFLILVKCCGQQNARLAFNDPLLRDLLNLDPAFTLAVLAFWQKQITRPQRNTFLRRFAEWRRRSQPVLTRREKWKADAAFLALPGSFNLTAGLDLALSVAAQALLRSFARRLPGFSGSSLPHLYGNFLDFPASFVDEPERRVIKLGAPPLNLILNITGMTRRTYRLSWLDERPFALFQEG